HEPLRGLRGVLAGEVEVFHPPPLLPGEGGPLSGLVAGVAAAAPCEDRPEEAGLLARQALGGDSREDAVEVAGEELRLVLGGPPPQLQAVPAAGEVGEDAGGARLQAAGLPAELVGQVGEGAAVRVVGELGVAPE